MFRRIFAVTQFTMLEEVRSKVLNATFLFTGVLIYFGLVLTNLAQGFEERFFRDIAFAMLELFGLVILLQSVYRVARQDVKKGSSVEMLFVRPIRRWEYLLGRFFGLAALLWVGLAVMGGALIGLIAIKGFTFHWLYGIVFLEVYFKLWIVLALAFFLTTITTSQASYLVSCLLVYASGHVIHMLRSLLEHQGRSDILAVLLIKPLAYLLPNFSIFGMVNNMDAILDGAIPFYWGETGFALFYALFYSGALLGACSYLFSKTEILPG